MDHSLSTLAPLIGGSFLAGLIDAIVGGGGLITVPLFMLILGPSASAIGSNKVAAVMAQVSAAFVYWRQSTAHTEVELQFVKRSAFATACGSAFGALLAPQLPSSFFKWMLLVIAPVVLLLVFSKNLWSTHIVRKSNPHRALGSIFFAGLYDGVAGPGGGTLMFLSIFIVGGMSAGFAITGGKFANLGSAAVSLLVFAAQGEVHWDLGCIAGIPIALGSFLGASISTRWTRRDETRGRAALLARSALVVVTALLITRFIYSYM